jgi:hypothetical protein
MRERWPATRPTRAGRWSAALTVTCPQALLADCHEALANIDELRLLFKGRALGNEGTLAEARARAAARAPCG